VFRRDTHGLGGIESTTGRRFMQSRWCDYFALCRTLA